MPEGLAAFVNNLFCIRFVTGEKAGYKKTKLSQIDNLAISYTFNRMALEEKRKRTGKLMAAAHSSPDLRLKVKVTRINL